jgi:glycosyltransferase involved in cell wall biosynthesis
VPASTIHWRDRPFGVNLYGFAFGELGIGEDVRMAVKACEAAGIPHRVVNVDPGAQLRQADQALAEHVQRSAEEAPFAFNIFCMPGFDMVGRVLMREGQGVLDGHCNIGWWPWELPVWPRRWKPAFDLVDEVWAATWYTEAMYRAATDKPVTWMPLPAAVDRVQPMSRQALGLPLRRFLYLFVFDLNSWLPRKNPWAVIDAFQRAYPAPSGKVRPGQAQVSLVLKTMNGRDGHPVWEAFKQRCAEDPRIVLLDKTLDRDQVLGLIQACDAYVSLHRAEGFGRTLAEAMLLGKPVVATDFSGNTDFLDQKVGFPVRWARKTVEPGDYLFVEPDDEAWWAEADVEHAAQQMQAAKASAKDAAFKARLSAHAAEVFSPVRIGAQMHKRLLQMWEAGR